MLKPIIKGAVLGGLVIFVWGMISWMVLPFHNNSIHFLDHDSVIVKNVQELVQADNTISDQLIISPKRDDMESAMQRDMLFITHRPANKRIPFPVQLGLELMMDIFWAGMLTWLVIQTVGSKNCACQYSFCTTIGIMTAVVTSLVPSLWWGFPMQHVMLSAIDSVVIAMLSGIVIVQVVRRCYEPEQA